MLLSFRVANFRSFLEEQELLLLPAYDKSRQAVPVAAIYGANASGKSNLLAAIEFMRTAVLDSFSSWRPDGGVPRDAFAFATAARDEESRFGVDLLLDGEKYVYGFALTNARVTEEWLYHHPHGRRRVLFERDLDDFRFGDTLRGPKTTIEEVTRPNSLFLSAAAQHGLEQVQPIYTWFSQELQMPHHAELAKDESAHRKRTLEILKSDTSIRDRFIDLLRAADFGVTNAKVDTRVNLLPIMGIFKDMIRSARPHFHSASDKEIEAAWETTRDLLEKGNFPYRPGIVERYGESKISLVHNTPEGPVSLSIEQESRGTRSWFNLLGLIIDALDHGRMVVIDELDTSLHPLLLRELVRLFQDEESNPHGAQLIFTTHDTSLLARHKGEEGLRRDEVWFTEKTRAGETRLYPLTDFKPRQGLNWERRYLGGSVGAVPFLDSADFAAVADDPPAPHD